MPVVKLFGNLRRYTEIPQLEVAGQTIREALNSLGAENSDLYTAIVEGDNLRPHVQVMVAGRNVALDQGLDTPLKDDDQIAIFPPVAGGQPETLRTA